MQNLRSIRLTAGQSHRLALACALTALLASSVTTPPALAHGKAGDTPEQLGERAIVFPNLKRWQTMVVDLHTHSVFSDGHVWPNVRVAEAQRDGLDALAITEHLEWQPHRSELPNNNRNQAYAEAVAAAQGSNLIVINGSELTREPPAGHINAVFVEDSNKLINPTSQPEDARDYYEAANGWPATDAVQAAVDQGAFVFWNHPYWTVQKPDGLAVIPDFHVQLAAAGKLHGIEIVNGDDYSEESHQIALDHNLAFIGTSDVHNLIDWDYAPHTGGHRPVTLVFAKTRSAAALREALFEQRTVVWFKNLLIGREPQLLPLLEASLQITDARYQANADVVTLTLENSSDAQLQLRNLTDLTFMGHADLIEIAPHSSTQLTVKPGAKIKRISLEFEVLNALTKPKTHPRLQLSSKVQRRPRKKSTE